MDSVTETRAGVDIVALTRALVDIDSTTGNEGRACRWLADYLRTEGFAVTEQPVDETRFNVIATPSGAVTVNGFARAARCSGSRHALE